MKSQYWTLWCGPNGNWDVNKSSTLPVIQKYSTTCNYDQHVMINCFTFLSCVMLFTVIFNSIYLLISKNKVLYKMICFGTASASYSSCVCCFQGLPQVINFHSLGSQVHGNGTVTSSNMHFSEHVHIIKQHTAIYIFVLQHAILMNAMNYIHTVIL